MSGERRRPADDAGPEAQDLETQQDLEARGDAEAHADPDAAARAALGRARAGAAARGLAPGTRSAGARSRRTRVPRDGVDASSQPYAPGRDPEAVGATLERVAAEQGWDRSLSVAGVVGRWVDVVGPQVAEHCWPETFEEGALVVRTDSTAWAMQVRLLVPQLQRRLAEEVGEGVVTAVTVLGPGGPTWSKGPRSVPGRGPRDTYG